MSGKIQLLNLAGRRFVVLDRDEYERLRALERSAQQGQLPKLPKPDAKGCVPALDFVRLSVAREIMQERLALGLTQEQLARAAGIRQETLSRLETGRQVPNVKTVEKIDAALKHATRRKNTTATKNKPRSSRN